MNKNKNISNEKNHLSDKSEFLTEMTEATIDNFQLFAEYSLDGILVGNASGKYVFANKAASEITGYSIKELITDVGIEKLAEPNELTKIKSYIKKRLAGEKLKKKYESTIVHKNGTLVHIELTATKIKWGKTDGVIVFFRDISTNNELMSNIKLNETLKKKTIALEELINHIQMEKDEFKNHIANNIRKIIIPEIARLKAICPDHVKLRFDKLKIELEDIFSPFLNVLEKNEVSLSPREIEICRYIKNGTSSKEIAALLNTSEQTVFKQRKNIRKKFNLSTDVNLITFLNSLIDIDDLQ